MKANSILFRCSSLGKIKAGAREKEGVIAPGVTTHLVDLYVSAVHGRREEAEGRILEKGNLREEDSLTLLSRVQKKFYRKNDIRLSNEFITGECDIFIGESIENADETIDTKTSWSANTFFRAKNKPLDEDYEEQGHGYMWLTGAKKHTVAYCLVNGTAQAIMDEKRRAAWKFGPDADKDPAYVKKCKQIEINHIFDLQAFIQENPWFEFHNNVAEWRWDIPMEERLHLFVFERDEKAIERIKNRVTDCRKWMDANLFVNEKQLVA